MLADFMCMFISPTYSPFSLFFPLSHAHTHVHKHTHTSNYVVRSRMQQPIAACTRAQSLTRPCPCATCNWLLHPSPTSAQDGLDPLQLVLVVFILPSISQRPHLHLQSSTCKLHLWYFSCIPPPKKHHQSVQVARV